MFQTLGLCGEAGEVAEKVKKILRDENGVFSDEAKQEIAKELGDVLWYIARAGMEIGVNMEDIVRINVEKLLSRVERGTVFGKGDNR